MPFGTVLTPQADAELAVRRVNVAVDFDNTSAKVFATLGNLTIRDPFILVLPSLLDRVPVTGAETALIGEFPNGSFEQIMDRLDFWVERGEEGPVAEFVVSIDSTATGSLRAWDGNTVRRTRGRHLHQVLHVGSRILCWCHCAGGIDCFAGSNWYGCRVCAPDRRALARDVMQQLAAVRILRYNHS